MSIGNRCPNREICIALSVTRDVSSPLGVGDTRVCNRLVLLDSVCFRPERTLNAEFN
jgi:hypothetical protein